MRAFRRRKRAATISSSCVRSCVTHLQCAAGALFDAGQEDRRSCTSASASSAARARAARQDAAPPVRVGAGPAPHADAEQGAAEQSAGQPAVQDSRVPDSPRRAARRRPADAAQAARRQRLRYAPGAHDRDDDAPHRLRAAERLRPAHRPADAAGVRTARAGAARCRRRRGRALHRLRRRRSPARDQREPRHARRRRGDRAHRRSDPHATCRRTSPPRASPAIASRCSSPNDSLDAARTFLGSLCETISELAFGHEGTPIELSASFGLAAVAEHEVSAVARAGRRRGGLQGGEGSRPRPRGAVSGSRSQHRAPLRRRRDHRQPARGDRQRSLPHGSAADRRAARTRAARGASSCCCA